MANLADALKGSIPAEEPDPIAPADTPDIEAEFEAEAKPGEVEEKKPPQEEPTEKKPEPEKTQANQVPVEALRAERKKRQEAEEKLAYLRGLHDGAKPDKEDEPSDEDLDNEFLISPSATLNSRVEKTINKASLDMRVEMSEAIMRTTKEDYQEKLDEFAKLANAHPELWDRARQERMPAVAIYNFMKARENPQQSADLEKEKAKWRAEWEEEQKKKEALEEAENTPPSPAGTPGSGETLEDKFSTIDDLFNQRARRLGR